MPTRLRYVPALGFRALTPLYDLAVRLTTREALFRDRLVRAAAVGPGERVLDLACGTGSTSVLLQQRQPSAAVCGLDIDPEVLVRARRKADRLALPIRFEERSATDPLDDLGPFDVVVSSLFFHHLDDDAKVRALANVRAALRDGGRLHVVDWGRPSGVRTGLGFRVVRLLDGARNTAASARGTFPVLVAAAGFRDVAETDSLDTALGTLRFFRATA